MSGRNAKLKRMQKNKEMRKDFVTFASACEDLRQMVDNLNNAPDLALRGGVFKKLDPEQVFTVKIHGWEVGYQLKEFKFHMLRKVFVKAEQPLNEIPEKEKNPVIQGAMECFIDKGSGEVNIEPIAPDCVMISQAFIPLFRVEKNPNIVVPKGLPPGGSC